jgi:dipeptidyl aminopeptidase/acylaminoacyl peptidase
MLKCIVVLAAAGALIAATGKPVPPTIEQMAAFPKMSQFQVSPDGKHMIALESRGEEQVILVWQTSALNQKPTVIGASQMKIRSVAFVKNDVLGVALWQPYDARFDGVTKTFVTKFFLADLEGKNWREPLPLGRAKTDIDERIQAITSPSVLDDLANDPDNILLVNNVGSDSGDIFKVNVRTNKAEKVIRSTEDTQNYVTDLEGNVRARTIFQQDSSGSFIATQFRDAQGGGWSEHFRTYVKDRDIYSVAGFTGDPNIALITSNVGQDRQAIYEYDIAKRKLGEVVFQHKVFEATGVSVRRLKGAASGTFGEITSLSYGGPRDDDIVYVSPEMRSLDATIRAALGIKQQPLKVIDTATGAATTMQYDTGLTYRITSQSNDRKVVTLSMSGANQPPQTFLLNDNKLTKLSDTFPDLKADALGKTELVYYKARDGQDIPAYLTKPSVALCGAGPWPTVIHPHGGPWARDDLNFDASMWVPLMSSRCMAVLQPQYRGSEGWGRKLWKAGDAEWGQKMQDDKDDGVKWLIQQNVAIPNRVAMFGFSYGGYAAFAAAVRPNGLYKCAIAGAGVSDIKRIWSKFYDNVFFRDNQAATVNGLNPVESADKISIPIMVYHGERDQTVPIEQSDWFVSKAKKSGQPVEYHKLADYAHGPAWTRKINGDQLRLIETYFAKGCGGSGL